MSRKEGCHWAAVSARALIDVNDSKTIMNDMKKLHNSRLMECCCWPRLDPALPALCQSMQVSFTW